MSLGLGIFALICLAVKLLYDEWADARAWREEREQFERYVQDYERADHW